MAISRTTDWSKRRYIMFIVFFVSELLAVSTGSTIKQKRQLFREQLLPHQGGKIPDTAFEPQRLLLNKFAQNGLFSTDGFYLEQRHPNRQQEHGKYQPHTLKINRPPDNRFVAPPGHRYHGDQVDTTYITIPPVSYVIKAPNFKYNYLPQLPSLSLDLLRSFKYQRLQRFDNKQEWNEYTSANEILKEFTPYLEKLHQLK